MYLDTIRRVGVEASWLAARVAADDAARAATVDTLLPRLIEQIGAAPRAAVRIVDIGAGSGANQRWLSPRLPWSQRWVHLDHDPAILRHTHHVGETDFVVGGVDVVADLLAPADGGVEAAPTMITCAAVLDVLSRTDLELLGRLVIGHRVPALLSLSVTGELELAPADELDQPLSTAFNAHQRRDDRAGPDAPALLTGQCRAAGLDVLAVETPWLLSADSDGGFVTRFLSERVEAAVEQQPALADRTARWLGDRLAQLERGELRIRVGHRDLLLLAAN